MDDNIFIHNETEYEEFRKLKPIRENHRKKVNFICSICGELSTKVFEKLSVNLICSHCTRKKARNDKKYIEKRKITCFEKYGGEPLANKKIREKINKTCNNKYGSNSILGNKKFRTELNEKCKKEFGVSNFGNTEKAKIKRKNTCLERYNVENVGGTKESITKAAQTCLKKYGKEHFCQTEEFAHRVHRKIEYDGLAFDSKPEVVVYKFCKENGLSVKYQPYPIEYIDSLKRTHTYFPDFEIEGKLYEIKGDYLWKDGRLWFPYRNTLSERELEEIDSRDLAKMECMRTHSVKVILSSQIPSFLESLTVSY